MPWRPLHGGEQGLLHQIIRETFIVDQAQSQRFHPAGVSEKRLGVREILVAHEGGVHDIIFHLPRSNEAGKREGNPPPEARWVGVRPRPWAQACNNVGAKEPQQNLKSKPADTSTLAAWALPFVRSATETFARSRRRKRGALLSSPVERSTM